MSHISLLVNPNNPVTKETFLSALASISPSPDKPLVLSDSDVEDYTKILAGTHEVFNRVLAQADYLPPPAPFPRKDIHRPEAKDNPTNAWAYKATIEGAKSGPLAGKTVCVKDNVALAEVPAQLGASFIEPWIPQTDATVVSRVLEAGGTITGKAVCESWSLFGVSVTANTGPISNAFAEGYSAGGSSSGTAVLVASGACDLGIGGDQGGSIRIPASLNGLVGMKGTFGLVPYTGIAPLERTLDNAGPMTKTVYDNALLMKVLAGADSIDDRQAAGCPFPAQVPDYTQCRSKSINGLKVGIITESLSQLGADSRVSDLVVKAAEQLRASGAIVETVSAPCHLAAPDLWTVVGRLSAVTAVTGRACGFRGVQLNDVQLLPMNQSKLDQMWPSLVVTLTAGSYGWDKMAPELMGKATNLARKVKDDYDALLAKYDVLITPTLPYLAPNISKVADAKTPLEKMSYAAGVSLNTNPFNLTGHPALSLPVGFLPALDNESVLLPVGMQIVGKFYDESTLYKVAFDWEEKNDWKTFGSTAEAKVNGHGGK